MQLQNIQADARFQLNVTSTDYSDTNINRAINKHYHNLFAVIMRVMGEWEVQGETATTALVNNQKEYPIPTDLLQLKRVEINYDGDTNTWRKAKILDISEVDTALGNTPERFGENTPYVRVFDNSMFLEPTPDENQSASLKIWYTKDWTELSSATDEPNIPECAVEYLIHGACLDFAIPHRPDRVNLFSQLMDKDVKRIEDYYTNKLPARKFAIKRKFKNYK